MFNTDPRRATPGMTDAGADPCADPSADSPAAAPFNRRNALALLALLGGLGVDEAALAQDASRVNPRAYRVGFENDRVRALEYQSRPGIGVCGVGQHSHPAHLSIALTAVKAKVTLPDGKVIYAQNQAGDMFWEEAITHTVENVGGSGARVVIVELKDANWRPSTGV